jgi:hypothetical protein
MRGFGRVASRWLLVALPATLAMTGCCGPDLEEVIKAHKPAIETKLAPLAGIRDQVMRLPPLTADRVTHEGPPLTLALANVETTTSNAALCYAEDLQDPEEMGFVWGRINHTGVLNECASLARRGHEVFNPANPDRLLSLPFGFSAEAVFERCEAVTTLLVIRTLEIVQPGTPEPVGSAFAPDPSICEPVGGGAKDAGTTDAGAAKEVRLRFDGGRIRAEVLVFALEGARFQGGFRVQASSTARVKGSDVKSDLTDKLRGAIAAGVKEHVSGATVRL